MRGGRIASLEALTRPVDREAVAVMKASAAPDVKRRIAKQTGDAAAHTFAIVFLFLAAAATFAGPPFLFALHYGPLSIPSVVGATILAALFATHGVWAYKRISRIWMKRGTWIHRWRMRELAFENRLNYTPTSGNIPFLGAVIAMAGREHWDTFSILSERLVMFGNVLPSGNGGEAHAPYGWGFLAVHLDAHLPRMTLVPRGRRASLRAPLLNYVGGQMMSLEGDFDKHFQLYVPADYARDALYVITPDLMALLIDHLPGSYVETFDDTLVVITPEPYDFSKPAAWNQLNLLLGTVIPKAVRQTRNYRDARSDVPGHVTAAGSRLRVGLSRFVIFGLIWIIALLVALVFALIR
jgi:hypothetical protein